MNATFANQVLDACDRIGTFGRYLDSGKVWIRAAWEFAGLDLDLEEFKAALVAAHRAGQLCLSRADLSCAEDPDMVRDSTTQYLGAEWHFIRGR